MADRLQPPGRIGAAALLLGCLALAAAAVPTESLAQGCAMCATYLNGQDPRTNAFRIAILFLMCMPFIVVGTAGGWIFWMHWRSRTRATAAAELRTEGEGVT